ncbi:MAG: DUF4340 domain-containing protein [SAR324 cluster bacterium]|nr:DUF4340 domain-containing protein [SAR324 cluster bacterium]
MKLKILGVVTVVLLVIALVGGLLTRREEAVPEGMVGQPLLQGQHVGGAAEIRIDDGKSPVTLKATTDGWVVVEQYDFSANTAMINRLLLRMTEKTVGRFITSDPKVYAQLGLLTTAENHDSAQEKITGIEFTVLDDTQHELYRVVLGNEREAPQPGMRAAGMYVRFPGEDAAYLIASLLRVNVKPRDWLDPVLIDFDEKIELQRFRIARAGKKPYTIEREDAEAKWKMAGDENRNLADRASREAARGLGDLVMVNVADPELSQADMGRDKVAVVEMTLFDQRNYTLTVGEEVGLEEYRYVTVSASVDPDLEDETVRKEVEAFNKKFEGRVFGIYDWAVERFIVDQDHFDPKS